MKTERSLQTKIANHFKKLGYVVEHLSPPSCAGWPDLVMFHDRRVILVEVKDFDQIGPKEKMSAVFQKSQPLYFQKCLLSHTPVMVVGYCEGRMWLVKMFSGAIEDIFELGRNAYLDVHGQVMEDSLDFVWMQM